MFRSSIILRSAIEETLNRDLPAIDDELVIYKHALKIYKLALEKIEKRLDISDTAAIKDEDVKILRNDFDEIVTNLRNLRGKMQGYSVDLSGARQNDKIKEFMEAIREAIDVVRLARIELNTASDILEERKNGSIRHCINDFQKKLSQLLSLFEKMQMLVDSINIHQPAEKHDHRINNTFVENSVLSHSMPLPEPIVQPEKKEYIGEVYSAKNVNYDKSAIRELLQSCFDDAELDYFCYDYFDEVYEKFADAMKKPKKVQLLLEYVFNTNQMAKLFEMLKQRKPAKYQEYEARLIK